MLTLRPYQQDAIDAFFAHVKHKKCPLEEYVEKE